MVKLIIGGTGSGKTKELIDQVNAAVKEEKGSVVCISRGNKLTFDISHGARLIDAKEYISQAQKSNDENRCFFLLPAAGLVRKNNGECCVFFPL